MITLALTACGSTSNLSYTPENNNNQLASYNKVIVNNFTDGVSTSHDDPVILSDGQRFADMIASKIKAEKLFSVVERNTHSTENALLIEGEVTKHAEGNSALRLIIGCGAGSSYFDANVHFKNNQTKKVLGNIDVSKMSWALGGGIAALQDVKSHMEAASDRIVEELKFDKERALTQNKAT